MGSILKGIGTTSFVATRVAMVVGAGLVALGAAGAIKERFWAQEETDESSEPDEIEAVEEN